MLGTGGKENSILDLPYNTKEKTTQDYEDVTPEVDHPNQPFLSTGTGVLYGTQGTSFFLPLVVPEIFGVTTVKSLLLRYLLGLQKIFSVLVQREVYWGEV